MKDMTRRSMTSALHTPELSPAALAFVREGKPEPKVANSSLSIVPAKELNVEKDGAIPDASAEKPVVEKLEPIRPRSKGTREVMVETITPLNLVSLSIRVPTEIPDGLLRASVDRKLKRQRPFTQQEIAAEALRLWLRKNGYLSSKGSDADDMDG